jgi:hypothetical protein
LGDGVPKLALGGPPWGVPGADPSSGPGIVTNVATKVPGGVLDRKSKRLNSRHIA